MSGDAQEEPLVMTFLAESAKQVDSVLLKWMPRLSVEPARLNRAMRYAATAGGKRIRPALAYAATIALAREPSQVDEIAAALELIHAYSLVHDDLPAMDDDDTRRGRPTCHIEFDEATAILAGDALQALAFEIVSSPLLHVPPPRQVAVVRELARACGASGMAGGQAVDLEAVGKAMDLDGLKMMHGMKTGALIRASLALPGIALGAGPRETHALRAFGDALGLAFQIKDDILDVEGDSEIIGKPQGSDAKSKKPTFPSLIGLEESRRMAAMLYESAMMELQHLPGDTEPLSELAGYIIERDR